MINYEITSSELASKVKTTPNKIVHYSAIFAVNMNKLSFRLVALFMHDQKYNVFNT